MLNTHDNKSIQEYFWDMADNAKLGEKFKIDKNLQYLKIAPLEMLKKIFIQYRFFTHFYIADLAILISKLPFGNLKSILAEILHEELGNGNANKAHPNLYDDFLASLGVSKFEMQKEEKICIANLQNIQQLLKNLSWAYGVGLRGMGGECLCQIYLSTMHHYFSQNPAIVAMQSKISWEFWDIHIGEVDLHHQTIVRAAISEMIVQEPEIISDLVNGYIESREAWDQFWKHIFLAAKI